MLGAVKLPLKVLVDVAVFLVFVSRRSRFVLVRDISTNSSFFMSRLTILVDTYVSVGG